MLFICDPRKNQNCKKTSCLFENNGDCFFTQHKEFAKVGSPAIEIVRTQDAAEGKE